MPMHRREEKTRHAPSGPPAEVTKPRLKAVKLSEGLTVKDFAEALGQKPAEVIRKLMDMGTMLTLNQPIPPDAAPLVAESFGVKVEMTAERPAETLLQEPEETEDARVPRPPVVTIMGHVDHGKTSLLDAIRQTRVTEGEAGGITQHIGAYVVRVHGKSITFLDTPGHEAFTAMRSRGAKVTDLVLLVVAADDGVMPQTSVANGIVIEAKLDRGRGPVATVLVQTGTLRVGDPFVVGTFSGRVRALFNDAGQPVKEAEPSIPVEVVGLLGVPMAGDEFVATKD